MPTTDTAADTGQGPTDIQARMFTGRMTEDPATGSATAAATALRAALRGAGTTLRLRVGQGVDMGRASLLHMRRSDRTACGRAWRVTRWS